MRVMTGARIGSGLAATLLCCLLGLTAASARANPPPLTLTADKGEYLLGSWLEILRDPSGKMTVNDVMHSDHWRQSTKDAVSLGVNEDDWWFRFNARSTLTREQLFLMELAYPSLDRVNVYIFDKGKQIAQYDMGDHYVFHERPVDHHNYVTPIYWPAGDDLSVYLHVKTSGVVQVPLTLWLPADFSASDQRLQIAAGLYFGAMLIMVIYNLFMYFGIRDRSFIYYVGFVACISLFVSSLMGYSYQYFWPNAPDWNGTSISFFLSLAVFFAVLFTHRFLGMDSGERPWPIRAALTLMYLLTLIMMASSLLLPYTLALIIVIVGSVVACGGALVLGVLGWWRGETAARHYVLAWSSLFIGGIILAGNKFSVIPQNVLTDNAVQIGSSMLVALLSFAIAHRINDERRRRYDAQLETLAHEREARAAKEEALQVQQQANRELEKKVRERTDELRQANRILEEMSATDVLTGLRNRRFFDDASKREYVRCFRYQRPIALIFVDIDHFKKLNDTHGHLIGDDGLRAVAAILGACAARDSDVVARYGGEEFCILLPETELEGATAVAERVRKNVENEDFIVGGTRIPITVSLGVACHRPHSPDKIDMLIKEADEALYNAKGSGRNRVCVFDSQAQDSSVSRPG